MMVVARSTQGKICEKYKSYDKLSVIYTVVYTYICGKLNNCPEGSWVIRVKMTVAQRTF